MKRGNIYDWDRDDPRIEQAELDLIDPDPSGVEADHLADVEEQRLDRQWDR